MNDEYIWITKNGNRIKIKNKQHPMDAFIRQKDKNNRNNNDDFFQNEGIVNKVKEITKRENRLNCCDIVAKEISNFAQSQGIDAKPQSVIVFHHGVIETSGGHYVVNVNDSLYDYTGKQFFGSNNPKDVELKIYRNSGNNFYLENNKIKINNEEEAIKYTEKNQNIMILNK